MSDKEEPIIERSKNLHKLIHLFYKEVIKEGCYSDNAELQELAEKWVEGHEKDGCFLTTCDDSYFMSSIIVFIPSKTEDTFMGYNVHYIGQNGDSGEFFLYGGHVSRLFDELKNHSSDWLKPYTL